MDTQHQRNVNFATKQLFDLTGTTVVPASIDPFFFQISHEEEGEGEEEAFGELERLEIKGLKYEKIKDLKFARSAVHGEDESDADGKVRAVSRLLRRIAAGLDHDDRDEDEAE